MKRHKLVPNRFISLLLGMHDSANIRLVKRNLFIASFLEKPKCIKHLPDFNHRDVAIMALQNVT